MAFIKDIDEIHLGLGDVSLKLRISKAIVSYNDKDWALRIEVL